MSFEGLWTAEVYGPFGWDNHGVLLLQDGRMVGGDGQHYATGTYTVSGEGIEAELNVDHYGRPRTIFGEAAEHYTTRMAGRMKDGVIDGTVVRHDRPEFDLPIRLVKRRELPDCGRA